MTKPPDLPPTSNSSAPSYNNQLDKQLQNLGQIDGMPFFRIVWAQDKEKAKRFWRGEWHFKYKHHSTSKYMQAEVLRDANNQFVGYTRFFDIDTPIPDGVVRETVLKVKEFGVPRFYIEMLSYHDPVNWSAERFTNERGEPEYDNNNNLIDFTGEYPQFGLEYDCLWLIAYHEGCCVERTSSNVGVKEDGSRCLGFRRLPQQQDVDMVARRFRQFQEVLGNKDLKADATDLELKQIGKERFTKYKEFWDDVEARIWDDTYQLMTPHTKRMITHSGQAADMRKYHFQNMSLTGHDVQHIRKDDGKKASQE